MRNLGFVVTTTIFVLSGLVGVASAQTVRVERCGFKAGPEGNSTGAEVLVDSEESALSPDGLVGMVLGAKKGDQSPMNGDCVTYQNLKPVYQCQSTHPSFTFKPVKYRYRILSRNQTVLIDWREISCKDTS
ncbi:hypothetical protein [Flexibacterium corallicola]|uniref:hypothetical protein n=1 Tax=Flexibacterium corallicola TaxID=3037259 RepID=UPI00286F5725|nr:hypothetical protein [Pseudovibrio sp. M1P-2-3]